MNRKKYQVFTPRHIVTRMLNDIGYFGVGIIKKKIIDISCGDGAFIIEASKRYIDACKELGMSPNEIKNQLTKHIFGCEIESDPYNSCKDKYISLLKNELGITLNNRIPNIMLGDGLLLDDNNKFDFVVGNPPYISYRDMNESQRKLLSSNFQSCKRCKFDYSYAFIEKSVILLKKSGIAAIIAPINMYKIKSGELLRDFFKPYLYEVVDVTEENVFPRVLTNPVISYFTKDATNLDTVRIIKDKEIKIVPIKQFYSTNHVPIAGERRFGDYFRLQMGVATLFNKAFLIGNKNDIEKEVLKKACSPKAQRYGIEKYIIFPYRTSDTSVEKFSESEFKKLYPKAYRHLLEYKSQLMLRKADSNAKWFEYGRSQAIHTCGYDKIMIPAIFTGSFSPMLLGQDDVVYAGIVITSKNPLEHPLSEAFSILNNERIANYIKSVGIKMNKKSYRFSPNDLEEYKY